VQRKLVFSLALVGPLTAVLLTASPASALALPTLPVPTLPVPTVPALPDATSLADELPSVTLPPAPPPGTAVTDTIKGVSAPVRASLPPPADSTSGLRAEPSGRAPAARSADAGSGASARGTGAASSAPSSGGQPASTDRPAASATPAGVRPAADVSGRRVVARPSVQSGPELVSTTQPRGYYFGWFGLFMAFTGRDIVGMLHLALAALCVGVGSMVAARRVLRPA